MLFISFERFLVVIVDQKKYFPDFFWQGRINWWFLSLNIYVNKVVMNHSPGLILSAYDILLPIQNCIHIFPTESLNDASTAITLRENLRMLWKFTNLRYQYFTICHKLCTLTNPHKKARIYSCSLIQDYNTYTLFVLTYIK